MPQPQRAIAERIDALAAKTLPGLQRSVKWGMAYYGVDGGWCFASGAFVGHVKLMFIRGTDLKPEPQVTPVAMGKATRGIGLASVKDLDERQVAAWIASGDDAVNQRSEASSSRISGEEVIEDKDASVSVGSMELRRARTTFGRGTLTMTLRSDRGDLSYSEITDLALSMPDSEKLKLAERLKKAGVKADWEAIFRAFRAPKLDQRTINNAVKEVRARRNGTKKRTATSTGR